MVNEITVNIVRKDIKNMHLAVYPPNGRVRVAVPKNVNDDSIRLFVISKLGWIKKQQRSFSAQERQTPREFINRESHFFQGKRYLMRVIENDDPPKVIVRNKTYIDLFVKPESTTQQKEKIINNWYRNELKKNIPIIIEKWQEKMGVLVSDWQVKLMKTKWGTCNIESKRIWVNLELAKKPTSCLEYIIVHEMVHLLERHHNDRFIGYMDQFLPNWRALKAELKNTPVSHADWEY